MKISALVICLVAAWATVIGGDKPSLFKRFMDAASSCQKEAGEGLKLGQCFKTFSEGGDTNTPDFNLCKCSCACFAEKFETLNADLSWKWDRLYEINEEIKSYNEALYGEGLEIGKQCENQVGGATDKCDATMKLFECAMKTSEVAKELAGKIAKQFS